MTPTQQRRIRDMNRGLDVSFGQTAAALGFSLMDEGTTFYTAAGRAIHCKPGQTMAEALAESEKDSS